MLASHRTRSRDRALPVLLLLLLAAGCGDDGDLAEAPTGPAEPAIDESPAPEAEAVPAEPAETETPTEPATEAVAPEPLATPPAPSEGPYDGTLAGLPAVVPGRPVRLDVVPTSVRRVDGRRVPEVAITDPDAKASLDALLADFAGGQRCRAKLATETFVSVECTYDDEMDLSMGLRSTLVRHFQLGDDGTFARVSTAALLHPKPEESERRDGDRELLVLLGRSTEPDDADLVFLRSGMQIVPRSEERERVNVGWRVIAPFLRADSALGRQLAGQGLELAPAGAAMPELPPDTWMVALMDRQDAVVGLNALPPALQADLRLTDPPALILTPGHERSDLPDLDVGEWAPARFIGPLATFGMGQLKESDSLRVTPGRTDELDVEVDAGERLYTVEGILGDRRSSADRGWCYAFSCRTESGRQVCVGGWIRARNLEAIEAPEAEGGGSVDDSGGTETEAPDDRPIGDAPTENEG